MRPLRKIQGEITIYKSRGAVWNTIADIDKFSCVLPIVKKSEIVSRNKHGFGVRRICEFYYTGASVEEKVIEWNTGKNIKTSWVRINRIYGIGSFSFNLEVRDTGIQTVLTGGVNYVMSNMLFDVFNYFFIRKRMLQLLDSTLVGYKYYIESGLSVTSDTNLDFSKVRRL